jgi:hypothetical protein
MISYSIVSPGFTIQQAALSSVLYITSGYTNVTPFICTVTLSANVNPADVLNNYSLFVQYGDNTEDEITQVTNSNIQSPIHVYDWPGVYEIKLAIIPKDGSAIQTYSNTFTATNFVTDTLSWKYTNWLDLSSYAASGAVFHGYQSCPPGLLNEATPLTFAFSASNQLSANIVFDFYSENSFSQPWEVVTPNNKYAQLRPRWRFTDLDGNQFTSLTASNISPIYVDVFGHLSTAASGILVGYKGTVDFYYIDDIPSLNYYEVSVPTLWVTYNTFKVYNLQDKNDNQVPSYSNSNVFLSAIFYVKNLSADHFGVSVNGGNIDLPNVIWPDTDNQFFVTVNGPFLSSTDFSNRVLLNYPLLGTPDPVIHSAVTPSTVATIFTPSFKINRYDSLNRDTGGYFKNILSTVPLSAAVLSSGSVSTSLLFTTTGLQTIIEPPPIPAASGVNAGPLSGYYIGDSSRYTYAYSLSGTLKTISLSGSSQFNVDNFYSNYFVRKVNENFNYGEQLQSYALTPQVADNVNLLTLLSAYAGDNVHPDENFGTVAYEKTANFVANNQDLNVAGVNQLYSLANMIDTEFDNYNYVLPPVLQRQFDLYSAPHERLWGSREKYNTNFDVTQGHTNLGSSLTAYPTSAIVYQGEQIVINDIFYSNFYELIEVPTINSYAAVTAHAAANNTTPDPFFTSAASAYPMTAYPLSAFFGWGLKTPFFQNYKAYVFNPAYTDTQVNNLIDWNQNTDGSLSTTLSETASSLSAWYADGGILENIYGYYITKGLDLIGSKYYQASGVLPQS